MQTLMQLLNEEYEIELKKLNEHVHEASPQTAGALIATRNQFQTRLGFVTFCDRYLAGNPAVEVFYPGTGVGLRLANQKSVTLGSASASFLPSSGDMQASGAVAITRGGDGFGTLPR